MVILGSVHSEFQFLCVSGTLGLEVTTATGTAKVLGWNLTRTAFFQTASSQFQKNCGLIPTTENGESLCIRVYFSFFFVFHAKSEATINHRTGLSDISCQSTYSRDSINIKNSKKS